MAAEHTEKVTFFSWNSTNAVERWATRGFWIGAIITALPLITAPAPIAFGIWAAKILAWGIIGAGIGFLAGKTIGRIL